MTRREEIEWEAGGIVNRMIERGVSQCYDTYYLAFQEGAKWADKTMIEKATQWLQNTLYEVATGLINRPDVVSIESTTMDDFINNFRKAMEE